jgi:hypothetical protein
MLQAGKKSGSKTCLKAGKWGTANAPSPHSVQERDNQARSARVFDPEQSLWPLLAERTNKFHSFKETCRSHLHLRPAEKTKERKKESALFSSRPEKALATTERKGSIYLIPAYTEQVLSVQNPLPNSFPVTLSDSVWNG